MNRSLLFIVLTVSSVFEVGVISAMQIVEKAERPACFTYKKEHGFCALHWKQITDKSAHFKHNGMVQVTKPKLPPVKKSKPKVNKPIKSKNVFLGIIVSEEQAKQIDKEISEDRNWYDIAGHIRDIMPQGKGLGYGLAKRMEDRINQIPAKVLQGIEPTLQELDAKINCIDEKLEKAQLELSEEQKKHSNLVDQVKVAHEQGLKHVEEKFSQYTQKVSEQDQQKTQAVNLLVDKQRENLQENKQKVSSLQEKVELIGKNVQEDEKLLPSFNHELQSQSEQLKKLDNRLKEIEQTQSKNTKQTLFIEEANKSTGPQFEKIFQVADLLQKENRQLKLQNKEKNQQLEMYKKIIGLMYVRFKNINADNLEENKDKLEQVVSLLFNCKELQGKSYTEKKDTLKVSSKELDKDFFNLTSSNKEISVEN